MNTNTNRIITATLTDGREIVIEHRNSLGGWLNALNRLGLTIDQIDDTRLGLPDSDRLR